MLGVGTPFLLYWLIYVSIWLADILQECTFSYTCCSCQCCPSWGPLSGSGSWFHFQLFWSTQSQLDSAPSPEGSVPAPQALLRAPHFVPPPSTTCWKGRGDGYRADLVSVLASSRKTEKFREWNQLLLPGEGPVQAMQTALSKRKMKGSLLSSALKSPSSTHSWQSLTQSQLAKEKLGLESLSLTSTEP